MTWTGAFASTARVKVPDSVRAYCRVAPGFKMIKYAIANCGYSIGTVTEHGWIFFLDKDGVFVSDLEEAVFFDSLAQAVEQLNDFGSIEVSIIKVNWHEEN